MSLSELDKHFSMFTNKKNKLNLLWLYLQPFSLHGQAHQLMGMNVYERNYFIEVKRLRRKKRERKKTQSF